MKKVFILSSLIFLFLAGCTTKPISIYPVDDSSKQTIADALKKEDAGGFFFSLPRTVIDVDTTIEVKSQTMGKYWKALAGYDALSKEEKKKIISNPGKYFEDFIKDIHENYVKEDKTTYKIKKGAISISSEPDPGKLFFAMVPKGKLETKGIKLTLTEQGTPTSAFASSTNNTLDYTFAAVKSVAAIVGTLALGVTEPGDGQDIVEDLKAMKKDAKTYWKLDEELKILLKSNAVQSSEAYDATIKPVLERMTGIKQKFTGSTRKETKTAKARIIPTKKDLKDNKEDYLLFSFDKNGVVFNEAYTTAKPFDSHNDSTKPNKFKIRLSTDTTPFNTSTVDSIEKMRTLYDNVSDKYPYGVPFNVPGLVKIEAVVENADKPKTVLTTEVCHLTQFGTMGHMPHSLDGKSSQYTLTYFQDTGAINVMDLGSTGFDSSNVNAAGEAIAAILNIETVRLQKEAARVEAKKKIKDAE